MNVIHMMEEKWRITSFYIKFNDLQMAPEIHILLAIEGLMRALFIGRARQQEHGTLICRGLMLTTSQLSHS